MKKRKLSILALSSCLLLAAGTGNASFLHAPHDEQHGVDCINCHEFPQDDFPSWGAPQVTVDDTVKNFICLRCHGPGGSAPTKAMHSDLSFNDTETWTTQCVDCHDPHLQRQLHSVADLSADFALSDMYLVTGMIDSVVQVGENTTISYTLGSAATEWTDPATWSAKTGPGRGLIFVADAANPTGQTFETLAADASTITVMGTVDPAMVSSQFGLLYGQFIKNRINNNLDGQDVTFFNPYGGYVDVSGSPPNGICQACHTNTQFWLNNGANRTHFAEARCTMCHNAAQGFKFVPHDHSQTIFASDGCKNCHTDPDIVGQIHFADCATCHQSTKPEVVQAIASGGPAECITCHGADYFNQHTHEHSQTVSASPACAGCHSDPQIISGIHDNGCTTCHYSTTPAVVSAIASGQAECLDCHGALGAIHANANHTATPGSADVLVFYEADHEPGVGPPYGDRMVTAACSICHNTDLREIHDNQCSLCHPTPYDTLQPQWNGGCQQGGCHTTYHEDASDSHWAVLNATNNCTPCHSPTWTPDSSRCVNCHNTFNAGDTTPPVTTSDAQSSYIGQAHIAYTITDSGKVGIGTTYSRLDGGTVQAGTTLIVPTSGSHTLEFWSVDQAGNIETSHQTANFTIAADTAPPVTTSNAQPSYFGSASIALTSTDNGTYGVKATHYRINDGPELTGTTINLTPPAGTTNYRLQFWSEDWTGNMENVHSVDFTVTSGYVTLRLVWGDSDTTGSPCPADPDAEAVWTIQNGTYTVVGEMSCAATGGSWSGVNDILVPVRSTTYSVLIDWYDSFWGYWDQTSFPSVDASLPGQVIVRHY